MRRPARGKRRADTPGRRSAGVLLALALMLAGGAATGLAGPAAADAGSGGDGHVTALPPDATPQDRAVAQARETGQPVVVDALTTPYAQTTANPDGTLTQQSTPAPTRVRQNGTWVPVDSTLKVNADGTLSAKAPLNALTLSGGGTAPLATLTGEDGSTLAIGMPFALPAPTVHGDTAVYADVLPDVDLDVTATDVGGIREVLVVKSAAAAADPALATLRLSTTGAGLTMQANADGGLQAVDSAGAVHFVAPTPTMWDSSTPDTAAAAAGRPDALAPQAAAGADPSTADGPGTGAQTAPLQVSATGDAVTLTPPAGLLHGAGTHYPVYIDPSYLPWKAGAPTWTWVQSAYPTADNFGQYGTSHSSQPGLGLCGTYPDGGSCVPSDKERTYYQFNTSALHSAQDVIGSATLTVTQTYSADWSCTNKYAVRAYASTTAIGHGTNWNNQPGGGLVGSVSVGGTGSADCGNVSFSYNATCAVRHAMGDSDSSCPAMSASSSVLTFGLYGDESDANGLKRLSNKATLSVTYDATPNAPKNFTASPTPRYASAGTTQPCEATANSTTSAFLDNPGAGGLQLKATVSSPTSPAQPVRGYFDLWDTAGTVLTGYTGYYSSGSQAVFTVPTAKLQDGGSYGWDVSANDGILTSAAAPGTHCHFRVDLTPPTVTVPEAPDQLPAGSLGATFPPSGNGQVTGVFAGGGGWVPFTATDPAPHGTPSGLACMHWSFDPTLSDAAWQCGAKLPSQANGLAVFPTHWGTNVVYVQAEDNAGNYSTVVPYAFYVPWNPHGPTPVFGDTTGDGSPDVLVPGGDGNLYAHSVPGNTQAASPAVSLAAKAADSPAGDAWKGYQVTHRGSMRSGLNVDDLIVHKTGSPSMVFYYNPGNTGTDGRFDKKQEIAKPPCPSCTDYAADWSTTLQVTALGDVSTTALDAGHFGHYTGLLTTETTGSGDAALWFYPTVAFGTLGAPVKVAATGWKAMDLMSPGDTAGTGKPGLWARNRTTGDIDSYTLTTGTTSTDADGDPLDEPAPIVTAVSAGTKFGNLVAANDPLVGSDGDLTGDGIPDLWSVSSAGSLNIRPGTTATGSAGSPVTGTAPYFTIGSNGTAADQWQLAGSTADTDTTNPATAYGATGWGPGHTGAANSALVLNGTTGLLQSAHAALDTSRSYTVSAWVELGSTAATIGAVSQGTVNHQAFYLGYQQPTHSWYFQTTTGDATDTTLVAATGGTRDATGKEQSPTTGVWTLITGVYDADTDTQTLYVDGVAANKAAVNPTPVYNAGGRLNIGGNATIGSTTPYNQWNGSIADVRAYPVALTPDEVHHLYTTS
ncbi:LamG-like jellyroll fold domain-containing protein [Actinacidiphila epipremni]|uniref:LamG domain-containing protein n=1 Tax=Actinacidiphila epipremni TaxID=2053013 RepID=A0ABX0ZRF8_9ACTN|nr:LamG-like jellyroll fold domain-containing protein [Actinacidiphila epipremni]NJP45600.1 LamG domain-containing protein [Actinacidiphila epipremni]